MSTASIDANVLLRALLEQDAKQSKQARDLLSAPGMNYYVSTTAIIEFVFVLDHHYGLNRTEISLMVKALAVKSSLVWDSQICVAAVEFYASHPKLSFEDCLMAEQASATDALPLFTFDKKLASQHESARLISDMED